MKKIKSLILIIVMLNAVFLLCCLCMSPAVNDKTAKNIIVDICEKPLPPKTEIVEHISKSGKLTGNGNGMQFFGAVLVKSELSLNELEEYYSKYKDNEWSYIVNEQKTQKIECIENSNIMFETNVEEEKYFIIYSWEEGVLPFSAFDLRGN